MNCVVKYYYKLYYKKTIFNKSLNKNKDYYLSISQVCVGWNIQVWLPWHRGSHTDLPAAHTPLLPRFHGYSHQWRTSCSGTDSECSRHRGNPVSRSGRGRSRSRTASAAAPCRCRCLNKNKSKCITAVKTWILNVKVFVFSLTRGPAACRSHWRLCPTSESRTPPPTGRSGRPQHVRCRTTSCQQDVPRLKKQTDETV